jgi:hypothetical protein
LDSGEEPEEKKEELRNYDDYPKSYKDVYISDIIVEDTNVMIILEDKKGGYLDSAVYDAKDYYYLVALTIGMQVDAEIVYDKENDLLEYDSLKFKNSLDSGTLISITTEKDGSVNFMVNGKKYLMEDDRLKLEKNDYVIFETSDGDTVSMRNKEYVLKKVPIGGVYIDTKKDIEAIPDDAAIFEISQKGTRKILKNEVRTGTVYTSMDLTKGSIYLVSLFNDGGRLRYIRVEDSQLKRKFMALEDKEYEITDPEIEAILEKHINDKLIAYFNYLEMPIKIDL